MHNTDTNIETAEHQKELFIATLVHDLKTPLQSQIASLEMLREGFWGSINEKQKEIIDIIIESSNYMKEMLHSLLEVYKFENGIIKLNLNEIDIDKLIQHCIKENNNLAHSKNVEIEYLNTNNCRILFADKYLIRRMLENLLNNGINYAFKNTKIIVTLTEYKNKIIIKVKNEGYIIPEDIKKHIFDKYVSGSHMNRKAGIGLGLYYCKRVVEVHGGNINLITNKNISEFIIELETQPDFSQNHNLKFV